MTDSRLNDVLHGREGNYLLPFFWQRGNHHDRIPAQIARIRESGCRAQIDAVYEPHFRRYAKYFGNVIAGFFSDEPQFSNEFVTPLARGRTSSGGKYLVFEVSLRLSSRAEHIAFDSAIRGLEGVRILL